MTPRAIFGVQVAGAIGGYCFALLLGWGSRLNGTVLIAVAMSGFGVWAARMWVKHGPFRARVWGIAFLALIPTFGFAYWRLPEGNLVSSTLRLENAVDTDAAALRSALTTGIRMRITGETFSHQGTELVVDSANVAVTTAQVTDDGRLILHTRIPTFEGASDSTPQAGMVLGMSVEVDLAGEKTFTVLDVSELWVGYRVRRTDHLGTRGPDLFGVPIGVVYPWVGDDEADTDTGYIFVPSDVSLQMQRFLAAVAGEPKAASGYFWRSMYFSVVTVTTLGFGDITPLSGRARLLVGAEAVLGVILVGLFLIAVDRDPRPKRAVGR